VVNTGSARNNNTARSSSMNPPQADC
jgi:hypothetical protein